MPDFLPFRGLRYRPGTDLSTVTAPPYDVIDEEERVALEGADDHNAVRLILPRDEAERDRYAAAAAMLADWRATRALELDAEESFYAYRMTTPASAAGASRVTTGVIGALALPSGDGDDDILPHEQTLSKARSDRLALLQATRANLDPIWGLSLGNGLTAAIDAVDGPVTTAVDPQGSVHELRRITDPDQIARIREIVRGSRLVIADGHHRYATARAYLDEDRDRSGAAGILAFVVELSADQLCIQPIHRLLTGGLASDPARLRQWLSAAFELEPLGPATTEGVGALTAAMEQRGALGLVDREGLCLLLPRSEVLEPALEDVPAVLHGVDSARLDALLGVLRSDDGDPGDDLVISYRDDAHVIATLVEKGVADAGVLLRPVDVETTRAAAFAGVRMPPKTTYFAPKPRTGMVMRSLDD